MVSFIHSIITYLGESQGSIDWERHHHAAFLRLKCTCRKTYLGIIAGLVFRALYLHFDTVARQANLSTLTRHRLESREVLRSEINSRQGRDSLLGYCAEEHNRSSQPMPTT